MTTEIHRLASGRSAIVFAADRLVVGPQGNELRHAPKVFPIPKLRAGVGWAGLAHVQTENGRQSMTDCLQDFFSAVAAGESLSAVATNLCVWLNRFVPPTWHQVDRSAIHLAGLDDQGIAEFWFIRNIDDSLGLTLGRYEAREDFRRCGLESEPAVIYRNGDLQAHTAAWDALDKSLGSLLGTADFPPPRTADEYTRWVRFKMKTISMFYSEFAEAPVVGGDIDAFFIA